MLYIHAPLSTLPFPSVSLFHSFTLKNSLSLSLNIYILILGEKMRDGYGIFTTSGEVFRGDFKQNVINGRGQYEFANGDVYKGELLSNMFDGVGTYKWGNGSSYVGQWYKNRMHGVGMCLKKSL